MTNETKSIIKARSLTVKEMRALRKAGLDPALANKDGGIKDGGIEVTAGMVDWILEHVYGGQIADDMPYNEAFRLATDTYSMTYGQESEAKN